MLTCCSVCAISILFPRSRTTWQLIGSLSSTFIGYSYLNEFELPFCNIERKHLSIIFRPQIRRFFIFELETHLLAVIHSSFRLLDKVLDNVVSFFRNLKTTIPQCKPASVTKIQRNIPFYSRLQVSWENS